MGFMLGAKIGREVALGPVGKNKWACVWVTPSKRLLEGEVPAQGIPVAHIWVLDQRKRLGR